MTPRMAERLTSLLVCRDTLYSSVFCFFLHFTRFFFISSGNATRKGDSSTRSADHRNFRRRIAGLAMGTCRKIHRRRRAAVRNRREVGWIKLNRKESRLQVRH